LDEEHKNYSKQIIELGENDSLLLNASNKYSKDIHNKIIKLWNLNCIQNVWKDRGKYHISDGVFHYLYNLEKYKPPINKVSHNDILYTRRKTIGIVEINYNIDRFGIY
jgi:hypothetical protein